MNGLYLKAKEMHYCHSTDTPNNNLGFITKFQLRLNSNASRGRRNNIRGFNVISESGYLSIHMIVSV